MRCAGSGDGRFSHLTIISAQHTQVAVAICRRYAIRVLIQQCERGHVLVQNK